MTYIVTYDVIYHVTNQLSRNHRCRQFIFAGKEILNFGL